VFNLILIVKRIKINAGIEQELATDSFTGGSTKWALDYLATGALSGNTTRSSSRFSF